MEEEGVINGVGLIHKGVVSEEKVARLAGHKTLMEAADVDCDVPPSEFSQTLAGWRRAVVVVFGKNDRRPIWPQDDPRGSLRLVVQHPCLENNSDFGV